MQPSPIACFYKKGSFAPGFINLVGMLVYQSASSHDWVTMMEKEGSLFGKSEKFDLLHTSNEYGRDI
jgi:hypothetical protein